MFYSSQLLSRKSALGICWLASHLEGKRLKRTQVFEVSITQSCDSILNPDAPLALRLSGQLLLGLVRIYQRKLLYLETDARSAIDGLQRSDGGAHNVDLPDGGTAPEGAITLPDLDAAFGLFGGELFPTFEVRDMSALAASGSGVLQRALGRGSDSLTVADDISDVFGSGWMASERRHDALGDGIDRRFSAELERLRSEAAAEAPRAPGQLFYDGADDGGLGGGGGSEYGYGYAADLVMEPPPPEMIAQAVGAASRGGTPASAGPGAPQLGREEAGITPASVAMAYSGDLPDVDIDIDIGGDEGEVVSGGGRGRRGPSPGAARQRHQRRRKKALLDMGPDGKPDTQLANDEIRRLLADRAPLLKSRGLDARELLGIEAPPRMFDIRAQSEAARGSFLYRPACFTRLAPQLLDVFSRAFGAEHGGALPGHARRAAAAQPAAPAELHGEDGNGAGGFGAAQSPAASAGAGAALDGYDDSVGAPDMGPADDDDDGGGHGFMEDAIEGSQPEGGAAPGSIGRSPGSSRLGPLQLHRSEGAAPGLLLQEQDPLAWGSPADGSGGGGADAARLARDGFTQRTHIVLERLRQRLAPAPPAGSKRRHPASTAPVAGASVTLDSLVQGCSRLEACRWFFEALVLKNKGYVDLHQAEPYGEITVTPLELMTAGSGGGGDGGPAPLAT